MARSAARRAAGGSAARAARRRLRSIARSLKARDSVDAPRGEKGRRPPVPV